jgi:hypothetical protein
LLFFLVLTVFTKLALKWLFFHQLT